MSHSDIKLSFSSPGALTDSHTDTYVYTHTSIYIYIYTYLHRVQHFSWLGSPIFINANMQLSNSLIVNVQENEILPKD